MAIDYSLLPEHIQGAAQRYVEHGIAPGGFLTAVICNDLFGAVGRADSTNRRALPEICQFWYAEAPGVCWGSPERMERWMNSGGLAANAARGGKKEETGE